MEQKTTIKIGKDLKTELTKLKLDEKETYEDIIWDLIEDRKEVSEETLRNIEIARKQFEQGNYLTHEQLMKRLKSTQSSTAHVSKNNSPNSQKKHKKGLLAH